MASYRLFFTRPFTVTWRPNDDVTCLNIEFNNYLERLLVSSSFLGAFDFTN
jgi:hypothetical protein